MSSHCRCAFKAALIDELDRKALRIASPVFVSMPFAPQGLVIWRFFDENRPFLQKWLFDASLRHRYRVSLSNDCVAFFLWLLVLFLRRISGV